MLIANGIRSDVVAAKPDHTAVTGDLVNIAAVAEFAPAARWLSGFGQPQNVSFVPGNHDCYVPVPYSSGLAHFEAFAEGDMKLQQPLLHPGGTMTYPYVRLRRNVALIGLTSGLPQAMHRASGNLGPEQLSQLAKLLPELRKKGYCRVVMIYHPPMGILANARRGLRDVAELEIILREHGAELACMGTITAGVLNTSNLPLRQCQSGVRLLLPCGHTNTTKRRDGRCSTLRAAKETGPFMPRNGTGTLHPVNVWMAGVWRYREHEFPDTCHIGKIRLPRNACRRV